MRSFQRLLLTNFQLYLREPVSTFFTLAFAPMLVVIFGAIYGNEPSALFGGRGSMDVTLPAYIGLIIAGVGILSMPINLTAQKESGVLRRFQATPLQPVIFMLADLVANLFVTIVGIIILLIVGKLLYQVHIEGSLAAVIFSILLGSLSMFSIGYLIASLAPSARAGQVIGMVLLYPMMFISGAGMPLEILPESMRNIARFMPLYYVVNFTKGMWFNESLVTHWLDLLVLFIIALVGFVFAIRLFHWK
jgi:ABC-2 type transport system permease protein